MNKDKYPVLNELSGIGFLIAGIIVAISLFSYSPSDKLVWITHTLSAKYHNMFGIFGAHVSGLLVSVFGLSSFFVPVFLILAGISRIVKRDFLLEVSDLLFSLFFVILMSGFLEFLLGHKFLFKGTKIHPGGIVGNKLTYLMILCFGKVGAGIILVFSIFLISMFLGRLSIAGTYAFLEDRLFRKIRKKSASKDQKQENTSIVAVKDIIKENPWTEPEISSESKEDYQAPDEVETEREDTAYIPPPLDLLNSPPKEEKKVSIEELETNAKLLKEKLLDFGIEGDVVEILPGPVVTMYEFKPAPGIKISKIASLSDDLAMALKALHIRIVAPLPGKGAIGIEIPNKNRKMVYLKEVLSSEAYRNSTYKLPIALGKDITGAPVVTDLTKMPHLLIAGATGTGKSVCINTMINSIIFKLSPEKVRFLLIDPKRIELSVYNEIPHLLHPVVSQPKEATNALIWAVNEMEMRYELLSKTESRNIETYNQKMSGQDGEPLPYIVIIIDELADLMMTSSKKVEESLARLAQMARAAGIHLILATQRPSVDVLTGVIKANFPTRISFQVSSKVDSRTILDTIGAENLLGNGDMLFLPPGVAGLQRIHGAFISEEEVKRITDFLKSQKRAEYDQRVMESIRSEEDKEEEERPIELDEKYEEAVDLVIKTGQASISMLQRKLRIGYNRAARMIEAMEAEGIVGPSDGIRPRVVYGRRGKKSE